MQNIFFYIQIIFIASTAAVTVNNNVIPDMQRARSLKKGPKSSKKDPKSSYPPTVPPMTPSPPPASKKGVKTKSPKSPPPKLPKSPSPKSSKKGSQPPAQNKNSTFTDPLSCTIDSDCDSGWYCMENYTTCCEYNTTCRVANGPFTRSSAPHLENTGRSVLIVSAVVIGFLLL